MAIIDDGVPGVEGQASLPVYSMGSRRLRRQAECGLTAPVAIRGVRALSTPALSGRRRGSVSHVGRDGNHAW